MTPIRKRRDAAAVPVHSTRARRPPGRAACVLFVAAVCLLLLRPVAAQSFVPGARIEMASVDGRLDHMDIDLEGKRLFVAALGANSVEVIDLAAGRHIRRLQPFREPQGVLYLPSSKRLFIANGAGGGVQAFADGKGSAVAAADALGDADNLRIRPAAKELVVGYGHALAVLDTDTLRHVKRIELPGHPEGFAVVSTGVLAYVNVPSARQIVVVDLRIAKITAAWDIVAAVQNFPIALDEQSHRVLVATRRPALLLVWDTKTGKRVAQLPICGDADDLFFDSQRHQLYAICGDGQIQVIRQRDPDLYEIAERVPTALGARTGLFVPSLATLYVAVPSRGGAPAEIRTFHIR